jgi:hypothetical protein
MFIIPNQGVQQFVSGPDSKLSQIGISSRGQEQLVADEELVTQVLAFGIVMFLVILRSEMQFLCYLLNKSEFT